jgi:ABC-2 type transport system permease protein
MVAKRRGYKTKSLMELTLMIIVIVIINLLAGQYYKRFDLTKEKRYTLSETSQGLANKVEEDLFIKIYLDGDLSPRFKQLKTAVRDLLNEYRDHSGKKIEYEFSNPLEGGTADEQKNLLADMANKGISPYNDLEADGIQEQKVKWILPGAEVYYGGKEYIWNFLSTSQGNAGAESINSSIEGLEYEFSNILRKCVVKKNRKIAFLEGHGELSEMEVADLAVSLSGYYELERLNTNLADTNALRRFAPRVTEKTQDTAMTLVNSVQARLNTFDGLIIAKPQQDFSKLETYFIDQFIMQGGKVIWMLDALNAEMDTIGKFGSMLSMSNNIENIQMQLFRYGVTVNENILMDMKCNDIKVVSSYQQNEFRNFPWVYYPVFFPTSDHPIVKNLEGIWSQFGGTLKLIDVDGLTSTPLLLSSPNTKLATAPIQLDLEPIRLISNQQYLNSFNAGTQVSGVLVEGEFKSIFKNRRKLTDFELKKKSAPNKMLVLADGDIARNRVGRNGSVSPLGFDRDTRRQFANKKFLLNAIDYLLDDSGLIEVRSKEITLRLLDRNRIREEKSYWQILNMLLPIGLIVIFGLANSYIRKKKYAS